jgi:tetratricopeptide (TPR) repeat protein
VILTRAGDAHRKLGNLEQAETCYRQALSNDYDVYAIIGMASIRRLQGKSQEAISSLESLISTTPELVRPYPDLLECYVHVGLVQKAHSLLESFSKHCHASPQVGEQMARTLQAFASA